MQTVVENVKEYEIDSSVKPRAISGHDEVTFIGNRLIGWRVSVESAIKRIESGFERFYLVDPHSKERMEIKIVRKSEQAAHLQACIRGKFTDTILALPSCAKCTAID